MLSEELILDAVNYLMECCRLRPSISDVVTELSRRYPDLTDGEKDLIMDRAVIQSGEQYNDSLGR